jgi:hypothetical protein
MEVVIVERISMVVQKIAVPLQYVPMLFVVVGMVVTLDSQLTDFIILAEEGTDFLTVLAVIVGMVIMKIVMITTVVLLTVQVVKKGTIIVLMARVITLIQIGIPMSVFPTELVVVQKETGIVLETLALILIQTKMMIIV